MPGSSLTPSEKVLTKVFLGKAGKVPLLMEISLEAVAENLAVAVVVVTVVVVAEENLEGIAELLVVDSLVEYFLGEPILLGEETSVATV